MKKIILITLLLLSSQVKAEEMPAWVYQALKVDNPNELAVWFSAAKDCPVTSGELRKIVSGVLIRSRVKPLMRDEWRKNSLYLYMYTNCLEPDTSGDYQIFHISIYFGKANGSAPILYDADYGYFGRGPKDYIASTFKEQVEEAMTDFIKANFGL